MRNLEAYYVARYCAVTCTFFNAHLVISYAVARSIGEAGGVAYARVVTPPDWVIDYWHPLEKAHFPEYFKRRETRKCEYIQKWHLGQLY
ncbi:hypothetical protein HF086_007372 [Spodoptera exigua]|uniref:Uncharacterized protein n=1 Tax=Spodoptera exigua TaxID=7107 RepID=A0A922SK86_SPOEX|nr:hypothetical protein HF086_007372 [Spodoptera exigua]